MSDRWDRHFLKLALDNAGMSKDPNTRVGAVIIGPDREPLSFGFNGLPRGVADTHERLHNRELKLMLTVHAEMNAVLNAARVGTALKGSTLYLAATDDSGAVWAGPPCCRCTVEIIQAGIAEIVGFPFKSGTSKWKDDIEMARQILAEAGVAYREVSPGRQ
jgi:dCMP deaminase